MAFRFMAENAGLEMFLYVTVSSRTIQLLKHFLHEHLDFDHAFLDLMTKKRIHTGNVACLMVKVK